MHRHVNLECSGAAGSCGTLAHLWDPHREDGADKCSCIVSFVVLGSLKALSGPILFLQQEGAMRSIAEEALFVSAVFD